jgi:hypothetical protein
MEVIALTDPLGGYQQRLHKQAQQHKADHPRHGQALRQSSRAWRTQRVQSEHGSTNKLSWAKLERSKNLYHATVTTVGTARQ